MCMGPCLPKYRGAGPIQWAVINGESETGITTMLMDAGMDTGAMLLARACSDRSRRHRRLAVTKIGEGGRPLAHRNSSATEGRDAHASAARQSQATMAPLLEKEDGQIDWKSTANEIANRSGALALAGRV